MGLLGDVKHLILLYLASVATVVALFTTQWQVLQMGGVKHTTGLFHYCIKDNCVGSGDNDLNTVLIVVGTLLCIVCTVVMTVHFFLNKCLNTSLASVPYVVLYITLIGGGLLLLGCALYGIEQFDENNVPGYSFALCIVGAILLPFGGAVGYRN